jgi:hypothetical protein
MVDSKRDDALVPVFLLYTEDKNIWLLGAHKSHIPNSEYFDLRSPYNYGGPNTNTNHFGFLERAWIAYKDWCWEHMILAEEVTLHPMIAQPYFGQMKFSRRAYTVGTEYNPSCRNKIRKAEANHLSVEVADRDVIYKHFANDYREAMLDIKAADFYLFNDAYFKALSELPGVEILICQDEFNWRSACVMLLGGVCMESHLTITNEPGRKLGATNYLIHKARQNLDSRCTIYLGGGKTTSDNDPLAQFKRSFGGASLPVHTGWSIHRPEVYKEMKADNKSERILFWRDTKN